MKLIKRLFNVVLVLFNHAIDFITGPFVKAGKAIQNNQVVTPFMAFGMLIRIIYAASFFVAVPSVLLSIASYFLMLSLFVELISACIGVSMALSGVNSDDINVDLTINTANSMKF